MVRRLNEANDDKLQKQLADKQEVIININKLNIDELDQLKQIAYETLKDMNLVKVINDRINFINYIDE